MSLSGKSKKGIGPNVDHEDLEEERVESLFGEVRDEEIEKLKESIEANRLAILDLKEKLAALNATIDELLTDQEGACKSLLVLLGLLLSCGDQANQAFFHLKIHLGPGDERTGQ